MWRHLTTLRLIITLGTGSLPARNVGCRGEGAEMGRGHILKKSYRLSSLFPEACKDDPTSNSAWSYARIWALFIFHKGCEIMELQVEEEEEEEEAAAAGRKVDALNLHSPFPSSSTCAS